MRATDETNAVRANKVAVRAKKKKKLAKKHGPGQMSRGRKFEEGIMRLKWNAEDSINGEMGRMGKAQSRQGNSGQNTEDLVIER